MAARFNYPQSASVSRRKMSAHPDWQFDPLRGQIEDHEGMFVHDGFHREISVVAAVLGALSLRALDPAHESGFFTVGPDAVEAFRKWKTYRDQVAGQDM